MDQAENKGLSTNNPLMSQELARLTDLFARQIHSAIDEAEQNIDGLLGTVLETARRAGALLDAVDDRRPGAGLEDHALLENAAALRREANKAPASMQFADRLNQRLLNVAKNLTDLATLLRSGTSPGFDREWSGIVNQMRATYTTEAERRMFDVAFDAPKSDKLREDVAALSSNLVLFDSDINDD